MRTFAQQAPEINNVITDPKEALKVMDFEEAAHRNVLAGHWAHMISGVDDDATLRANREAYKHVQLRPRRLRDATKVDMRTELFGTVYASPIFTCPTGGEKYFHPDSELAVARATKTRGTMQMLATTSSTGVEG
jgi:isopentenyl diphosphate isomerase/L-lactate dehydrogenase-like FMN-dependent dehydrogenase